LPKAKACNFDADNCCQSAAPEFSGGQVQTISLSMGLKLRFFGAWAWHVGETALPRMRSRQGQWLLALLVLKRASPVDRAWLAAALWPESSDTQALYNLRRNLTDLRKALGSEAWRLHAPTARTLSLDLSGVKCDLIEFDDALAHADTASLEQAVTLYQGPLLPGCLEEWVVTERASREDSVLSALETLAASAIQHDDPDSAAIRLRRAVEIDPLRESAVRSLMCAQSAGGSYAAAVETYRVFRLRLRSELNADPDTRTVELFRRMRADGRRAAAGIRTIIPVAATPAAGKTHLPTPLTPLIGREREIREVTGSLDQTRLLTLTGIGGIGKTRLALAVAQNLSEEYADGAWFVDLTPLSDPTLLTQSLLSVLHTQEQAGYSPWETLVESLRSKRLLLVLDNCEHLAQACAKLAQALLSECAALHILATSRETLRVTGEVVWRVPPLSLPIPGDQENATSEAFHLFTERAAQANPGFSLTSHNSAAIVQICVHLDGIPLALEMAAARMRAMTAAQVAARLDDRFQLLTAPRGELRTRQQTLRATLDWSYEMLTEEEQTLLAQVSVFAGGWTLEAAEAVCLDTGSSHSEGLQTIDFLSGLLDKSLLLYEEGEIGGRYRLLETVRRYGQERLQETGKASAMGNAHRDYFLAFAEQARAHLAGPTEVEWLDRLALEHDNFRAALAWSQVQESAETNLRLTVALARFWRVRGHLSEGRAFLSAALQTDNAEAQGKAWREALREEGQLALAQGQLTEALHLFEQALTAARQAKDSGDEAAALGDLGIVRNNLGEYELAQPLLEHALSLNRKHGNREEQAANLGGLGYLAREAGDTLGAEVYLTEAVALSREQGDLLLEGANLGSLAYVLLQRGEREEAHEMLERTLTLYRGLGNLLGEAWTLSSLGYMAAEAGQSQGAHTLIQQALDINRAVGNRAGESWNLNILGELQSREDQHSAAEATLQQALQIDRELGSRSCEVATLKRLGDAARKRGDRTAARRFYTTSLALIRALNLLHGTESLLGAIAELGDDTTEN
jgi:predicted ATPase/DNA-binding SARP family transcriptional activator